MPSSRAAMLLIISGPSGSGKTRTQEKLCACHDFERSISVTTRPPRSGDREGKKYIFVSDAEFDELVCQGAFIEWAWVHGERYGTLLETVLQAFQNGKKIVLVIDVQGHALIRQNENPLLKQAIVSIFIQAPSIESLKKRILDRDPQTDKRKIEERLENALGEMARKGEYDYVVTNHDDEFDRTFENILSFLEQKEPSPAQ